MQPATATLRVAPRSLDLDVGVIYTHERTWMPRLLSTLYPSADGLQSRLILVDNASTDGARQWKGHFPHTTIVRNSRRLLYAANLNRILQTSTAPYILLLNTDLLFEPDERCLTKMVEFMERTPDCGIAGCQVFHLDGSYAWPARRFQTMSTILGRRCGLGRLMPRALDHYLYRERDVEGEWDCDWLSGCFLLLRREAFQQVGWFDTGFVKYFEDVDMCLRMSRGGWRTCFFGGTYYFHLETRSSANLFSLDALRHARSYARWLAKWGFDPGRHVPQRPAVQPIERREAA